MKMIRWAKPLLALAIASAACVAFQASAQVYVRGYTRADGTYVQGYYRTSPNNTRMDNYSTRGNVNPYTGTVGTKNPYYTPPRYSAPLYQPLYQPPPPPAYRPQPVPRSRTQSVYGNPCCSR